jgi:hypothetical protein
MAARLVPILLKTIGRASGHACIFRERTIQSDLSTFQQALSANFS